MVRKPLGKDRDPEFAQADVSPEAHGEEVGQIVEMAAEQLADLLWRHWLYMQKLKKESSKEPDS